MVAKTLAALLIMFGAVGPVAAAQLEMILESVPTGAQVEQGGKVLGKTPLRLNYPTGYFATRATVWGAFLGAPLEFTLSAPGYEPKTVKLGNGPHPWRNLYGQILYQYYLLDRAYRVELTPAASPAAASPAAVDPVGQLERLAALRAQGVLTEQEFEAAKARVLSSPVPPPVRDAVTASSPRNPLDDQDPTALCWRLVSGLFDAATETVELLAAPSKQESTAFDGSDREVALLCSWRLPGPQAPTLKVSIVCPDSADAMTMCNKAGRVPGVGEPVCSWTSGGGAEAITQGGCVLRGALAIERRTDLPPGFTPPATIDVHQVVRAMAVRIGGGAPPPSAAARAAPVSATTSLSHRASNEWHDLSVPPAMSPLEECPLRLQLDLGTLFDSNRAEPMRAIFASRFRCNGANLSNLVVKRQGPELLEVVVESEVVLEAGRDKLATLEMQLWQGDRLLVAGRSAIPLDNGDTNWEDPVRMRLVRAPEPPPTPAPVLRIEMKVEADG